MPDIALWGDSDVGLAASPPAAFSTNVNGPSGDPMATIGHIGRYALKFRIGEGGLGTVLDAGVSDDKAYIAMELLKGRDLRQLRQDGWRPTPSQAALIVRRVADALAYAHSKGVVHRDVKPANIFMVGRTQPRVLHFGIARVAHQIDIHTGDDIAGGSPYYMAPEQVREQPVDRRADVFSLGVVLYELLTDVKPFQGDSLSAVTTAVLQHTPPMAHTLNRDVPKVLSEITAQAMETDPHLRHRSARALSRELRHWLDEHGELTEVGEPLPAPAACAPLPTDPPTGLMDVAGRPAEKALLAGIRAYEDGQCADAERQLALSLQLNLPSAKDRAAAQKAPRLHLLHHPARGRMQSRIPRRARCRSGLRPQPLRSRPPAAGAGVRAPAMTAGLTPFNAAVPLLVAPR